MRALSNICSMRMFAQAANHMLNENTHMHADKTCSMTTHGFYVHVRLHPPPLRSVLRRLLLVRLPHLQLLQINVHRPHHINLHHLRHIDWQCSKKRPGPLLLLRARKQRNGAPRWWPRLLHDPRVWWRRRRVPHSNKEKPCLKKRQDSMRWLTHRTLTSTSCTCAKPARRQTDRQTDTYAITHTHTLKYMNEHIHACTHAHMHTCTHAHMRTSTHVHKYTLAHI